MVELIFVIILIIIVLVLILYNLYVKRNFKTVEKSRKRLDDLSVLNDLVKITASLSSVNDKLENINDALIKKFQVDYSSIVIFDGKKFQAKASNLDPKSIPFIEKVYTHPVFKDSIENKEAKYITVENPIDNLVYLEKEKVRAKTAVFFPLYMDTIFVGFWLIESKTPKGFQELDMQIMIEIKSRILDIIRTMSFQSSMENMVKEDLFSSLKTYEHLLTEGKFQLEEHNESTILMYRISNLEEINEEFSRHAGNMIITNVTNEIAKVLEKSNRKNIFVRYSGPKFAIAFPGLLPDDINSLFEKIQNAGEAATLLAKDIEQDRIDDIENIDVLAEEVEENDTEDKNDEDLEVIPQINVVIAKYYRGLGLEVLTKELEDFLEEVDSKSSITRL